MGLTVRYGVWSRFYGQIIRFPDSFFGPISILIVGRRASSMVRARRPSVLGDILRIIGPMDSHPMDSHLFLRGLFLGRLGLLRGLF